MISSRPSSVVVRTLAFLQLIGVLVVGASAVAAGQGAAPSSQGRPSFTFDDELKSRASFGATWRNTRLILQLDGKPLPAGLKPYVKARLDLIDAYVLDVPDRALKTVAAQSPAGSAHFDRPIWATDYLSTRTTAANAVWRSLGYTGKGVGVAVIDSGISTWHDDLTSSVSSFKFLPNGNQRVSGFVDFVNGQKQPYDDHGHGSHVAGIILGNGYDSYSKQAGIAPMADLVALKVLDKDGKGSISNIIAALDWVVKNAKFYNIKVVNLSAGTGVTESYWTDPLTLAAKRVVDRGIVVVTASGNLGKNAAGQKQYGGILCPGNAPWVLTVGASSTEGTVQRLDDKVADFSSRGPTRGDYLAKPDLVAPGYGILSFAVPGSALYSANLQYTVEGQVKTAYPPYVSLSGSSMAAPQVAGTVALMFEANPRLTPNFVKAILQYTAQTYTDYDPLEQGAGFLDSFSAVRLAKFYDRNKPGSVMPVRSSWSGQIIWGNHALSGGYLNPLGNAWAIGTVWGADSIRSLKGDDNIVWGTACDDCDNIVWGTRDANGDNIVWGTRADDNIVWGTTVGDDDNIVWGTNADDNIVWGTSAGSDDNIVWGTDCGGADCDNIVWGTHTDDNIVWGTLSGDDNIVWGTARPDDNIVWGTNGDDNIVWGTNADDNIVWGTNGADNIVWGTNSDDNIVWGTAADDNIVWGTQADDNIVWGTNDDGDNIVWGTTYVDGVLWGPKGLFNFHRGRGGNRGAK